MAKDALKMKDWGGNGRWTCGRKFLVENFRSKMWKKLQKYEPKYKTIIFGQSLARFNVLWFGFETQWLTTLYFISNLVRTFKKILLKRLSLSDPGWEELQWIPISWSPWSGKNDRISKADFRTLSQDCWILDRESQFGRIYYFIIYWSL